MISFHMFQQKRTIQLANDEYDKKVIRLYSVALLFVSLVFGFLFELRVIMLIVVTVGYLCCIPQLLYNHRKFLHETQRFNDINAYMSQMAQSFVYTKDVIKSLEETITCFPNGLMHETLQGAFEILEAGKWDIKAAERDALAFIESRYDCEKLRNLHTFFLNSEELGGECQREFGILENMRIAWQGVIESIRVKKLWDRNIGTLIYAFFLIVCVIMLHIMRNSNLNIITLLPTQILDFVLLMGFALYFVFMDNRLNKSLLMNPVVMSEGQANAYFEYLENYNTKNERKKYRAFAILSITVSVLLVYLKPSWITLAVSVCIIFVGFNMHTINYVSVSRTMRAEINKAFPKWLFDIMLLLQRESVEGAIEASVATAPPVLKRELLRITDMLAVTPHNPDAYMSFLKNFQNQNMNEIMHKLYSLTVGANRDSEVLDVVIEKNIKNLEKAERDSMMFADSMKSFVWIPFLCVGFGCMGYLVIAIVTSISSIIQLF